MGSWLKKWLSREASNSSLTITHEEDYLGYLLQIQPRPEGHLFRVAALISKKTNPNVSHLMIRADLCPNLQIATQQSLYKARQAVDQLADQLFQQAGE